MFKFACLLAVLAISAFVVAEALPAPAPMPGYSGYYGYSGNNYYSNYGRGYYNGYNNGYHGGNNNGYYSHYWEVSNNYLVSLGDYIYRNTLRISLTRVLAAPLILRNYISRTEVLIMVTLVLQYTSKNLHI